MELAATTLQPPRFIEPPTSSIPADPPPAEAPARGVSYRRLVLWFLVALVVVTLLGVGAGALVSRL